MLCFKDGWNNHGIRTEHNQSPNQLFVAGALRLRQSGLTALDFFDCVSDIVYCTHISYRTRMVHTVYVYMYGTTVCLWYSYLYHMCIATTVSSLKIRHVFLSRDKNLASLPISAITRLELPFNIACAEIFIGKMKMVFLVMIVVMELQFLKLLSHYLMNTFNCYSRMLILFMIAIITESNCTKGPSIQYTILFPNTQTFIVEHFSNDLNQQYI